MNIETTLENSHSKMLLEMAVAIAVEIAYHGPEELREAVRAATLAEALERWEELLTANAESAPF